LTVYASTLIETPMTDLAPSEQGMWERVPRTRLPQPSDQVINEKYDREEQRIVTESNREKLPNFIEALKRPHYMNPRPQYQRRPRWDDERQSRLIESFVVNIPVPPLFIYETQYNTYEVMDGQQRISAIQRFYANDLTLKGLDVWPELNGKKYSTLPEKIRAGIDRRSISYVVVLKESAESEERALLLKQLVFGRLNTGGVKLTQQEVRNSLYQGPFNDMLFDLAGLPAFREAWGLPRVADNERLRPPSDLLENKFYVKMEDVELVLRFFALRHVEHYQRGMQGFLNVYMIRSRRFSPEDLAILKREFVGTLSLASELFGKEIFRPYNVRRGVWAKRPQKAFYDAVMVGLNRHLVDRDVVIARRRDIVSQTMLLFANHPEGTFTGRGNTKEDVKNRIDLFSQMVASVIAR
jgi:hypothetical protein